jgi:hypothetical protein
MQNSHRLPDRYVSLPVGPCDAGSALSRELLGLCLKSDLMLAVSSVCGGLLKAGDSPPDVEISEQTEARNGADVRGGLVRNMRIGYALRGRPGGEPAGVRDGRLLAAGVGKGAEIIDLEARAKRLEGRMMYMDAEMARLNARIGASKSPADRELPEKDFAAMSEAYDLLRGRLDEVIGKAKSIAVELRSVLESSGIDPGAEASIVLVIEPVGEARQGEVADHMSGDRAGYIQSDGRDISYGRAPDLLAAESGIALSAFLHTARLGAAPLRPASPEDALIDDSSSGDTGADSYTWRQQGDEKGEDGAAGVDSLGPNNAGDAYGAAEFDANSPGDAYGAAEFDANSPGDAYGAAEFDANSPADAYGAADADANSPADAYGAAEFDANSPADAYGAAEFDAAGDADAYGAAEFDAAGDADAYGAAEFDANSPADAYGAAGDAYGAADANATGPDDESGGDELAQGTARDAGMDAGQIGKATMGDDGTGDSVVREAARGATRAAAEPSRGDMQNGTYGEPQRSRYANDREADRGLKRKRGVVYGGAAGTDGKNRTPIVVAAGIVSAVVCVIASVVPR